MFVRRPRPHHSSVYVCVAVVRHAQCRRVKRTEFKVSDEPVKMFGFHKSKIYRSNEGCCICKTKSSSSRFTDSSRYEENFRLCFGLSEDRVGDICNACVLLVKRWKKLPHGSKKNWNHVVDARAGPGFKLTKPKKVKNSDGKKKSKLKKLHKFKRQNSDAHSTTSSMSPSQSPSHSNQSDDGSDIETKQRRPNPSGFSFLDLSYWKRYSFPSFHECVLRDVLVVELKNHTSFRFQEKGVLWDRLQGAFRRGDHRSSSLQALL
uniref:Sinhcafl antisense lncRNA n=1 Tax=Cyprinus carpio carpio TaxID=630221 RepID=A0A9J7YP28_CYPCA